MGLLGSSKKKKKKETSKTITYSNGDVYVGEFKNGLYNGKGTYLNLKNNNTLYIGEFIDEMVDRYGQEYNFGLPEYRAQGETLVDPQRILSK